MSPVFISIAPTVVVFMDSRLARPGFRAGLRGPPASDYSLTQPAGHRFRLTWAGFVLSTLSSSRQPRFPPESRNDPKNWGEITRISHPQPCQPGSNSGPGLGSLVWTGRCALLRRIFGRGTAFTNRQGLKELLGFFRPRRKGLSLLVREARILGAPGLEF